MNATAGVLCPDVLVRQSTDQNLHDETLPSEGGYYGGTESEKEDDRCYSAERGIDEDMDSEEKEDSPCNEYGAINEFVHSFRDNIPSEDFVRTACVQNQTDGFCVDSEDDIAENEPRDNQSQHPADNSNQSGVCDHDKDVLHASMHDEGEQDISACVLGDCGCVRGKIEQEIAEEYLEEQKLGYKKR